MIRAYISGLLMALTISSSPSYSQFENRLKVAIIDSGLDLRDPRFADVLCQGGHKDFTGTGLYDNLGHGTHVAGIVSQMAYDHTKYCLVIVKISDTVDGKEENYIKGLEWVVNNNIKLANMSMIGRTPDDDEKSIIQNSTTIFVAAAGNDNKPYTNRYPGAYNLPNVRVVGNWDCKTNQREPMSNYGPNVIWRCGTNIKSYVPRGRTEYKTGTSMAAPMYTAEEIVRMTK
jgi:subtilisin family serine protease